MFRAETKVVPLIHLAIWLTRGAAQEWDVAHEERPTSFVYAQVAASACLAIACVVLPLGPNRFGAAAAVATVGVGLLAIRKRIPDANFDGALAWLGVLGALGAASWLPLLLPAATVAAVANISGGASTVGRRSYVLLVVAAGWICAIGLIAGVPKWWLLCLTMLGVAPGRIEHAAWIAERDDLQRTRVQLLTSTGGALRWEADMVEGRVLNVLGESEAMLGYSSEALVDWLNSAAASKVVRYGQIDPGDAERLVELPHIDGSHRWFKLSSRVRKRADGHAIAFGVVVDVHELETARRHEQLRAERDALTGLANRDGLAAFLNAEVDRVGRAVIVLDLDRFKDVNDTLGHLVGDRLIAATAGRLGRFDGDGRCVARLGGDEFAIAIVGDDAFEIDGVAERVAQNIGTALASAMSIDDIELHTSASLGLASGADLDWTELLRRADVAMYEAKRSGLGHRWFAGDSAEDTAEKWVLRAQLTRSLEDEIMIWFQPIVSAGDHRLVGVECLARWNHPEHGLLPPGVFLPIIDQAGLTRRLDEHVLTGAVEAASLLAASTSDPITVSANLSPRSLWSPTLLGFLDDLLRRNPLAQSRLTIEITEQGLLEDHERILPTLLALGDLGVGVALDDFGTGASSLIRLRSLPFTVIKIDQSFVGGLPDDRTDLTIVKSTIELAHELGMSTVAEGVETDEQAATLDALGCDSLQGFAFDKAVPLPEVIERWVLAGSVIALDSRPGR